MKYNKLTLITVLFGVIAYAALSGVGVMFLVAIVSAALTLAGIINVGTAVALLYWGAAIGGVIGLSIVVFKIIATRRAMKFMEDMGFEHP